MDPLFRYIHLIFPDCFPGGMKLAVQICQADPVVINQVQCADSGTYQRFHRIAAHPADSENRHAALGKLIHGLRAKKKLCSGKLIQHSLMIPRIPSPEKGLPPHERSTVFLIDLPDFLFPVYVILINPLDASSAAVVAS